MRKNLPYDPVKDFAPIALIVRIPRGAGGQRGAAGAFARRPRQRSRRSTPGGLSYALGRRRHLGSISAACSLRACSASPLTHVPYKGMSPAINDVAGGHIPFMFSPIPFAVPLAQAGKLRMLGVTTAERVEIIAGGAAADRDRTEGFDARRPGSCWWRRPARRPASSRGSIAEVRAIIADPEVRQEFIRLGLLPVQSPPPAELKRFVQAEIVRWGDLVRKAGLAASQ